MGVGNRTPVTYIHIKQGRFWIKENDVYKDYSYVEGWITGIDIVDDEYKGKKLKKVLLKIDDGSLVYQLQFKLNSGYGRAFCCMVPNLDPMKDVQLSLSYKERLNQNPETGMFIRQENKPVKWFYTKENPNGLPNLVKHEIGDDVLWDNKEQQLFFINLLLQQFKPSLPAFPPTKGIHMHTARDLEKSIDTAPPQNNTGPVAIPHEEKPATQPPPNVNQPRTFIPQEGPDMMDDLPF